MKHRLGEGPERQQRPPLWLGWRPGCTVVTVAAGLLLLIGFTYHHLTAR